jgi:hypothetical protein
MKTVRFVTDFGKHKRGEVVTYIVDEHANTLLMKGVVSDTLPKEEKTKKKK